MATQLLKSPTALTAVAGQNAFVNATQSSVAAARAAYAGVTPAQAAAAAAQQQPTIAGYTIG